MDGLNGGTEKRGKDYKGCFVHFLRRAMERGTSCVPREEPA